MRKGFHCVALCGGTVIAATTSTRAKTIVDWCLEVGAQVVAVDAPCRWSLAGRSRFAERDIRARTGISTFSTPHITVGKTHPFYEWVRNGQQLYRLLEKSHPLFNGEAGAGPQCMETFPQAVACALAQRILPAKRKCADRRDVLVNRGLETSMLKNIDFVDAALCALAALYLQKNSFDCYGDDEEGFIVVPAVT
jgi:predicted RNase H-like nuclease